MRLPKQTLPFKSSFELTWIRRGIGGAGSPNIKFRDGIEKEHTKMAGCDTKFTTNNYGVTTTPRKEYAVATGKQECPKEDMMDRKKRKVRRIRKIDAGVCPDCSSICHVRRKSINFIV